MNTRISEEFLICLLAMSITSKAKSYFLMEANDLLEGESLLCLQLVKVLGWLPAS